jgi:hypothetical protein
VKPAELIEDGSVRRLAAAVGGSSSVLTRVLGRRGSSSRIRRRISSTPPARKAVESNGNAPTRSSYSMHRLAYLDEELEPLVGGLSCSAS